jgi:hypothetical protein
MEKETTSNAGLTSVPNPVPVPIAAEQTYNWRQFMLGLTNYDPVNGYFIPKDDILAVLQYATNGIRVYFALPPENDMPLVGELHTVHLYVVAVDGQGNDRIHNPETLPASSMIYDTTVPCPTLCGSPNVLNGLLSNP